MMHRNWLPLKAIAILAIFIQGCSGSGDVEQAAAPAPEAGTARVYIISPANGETVSSPVTVKFGIENFAVAPAGTFETGSGHHHLLVDTEVPPLDRPIPTDANHLHFGKGQTETELELAPGQHTLQLLLGDGAHIPHTEPLMSERITITVE
jgi:hypothetical protein